MATASKASRKRPRPRSRGSTSEARARAKRKRQDAHRLRTYGITSEEYDGLKASQGGKCALCRKATGASRALSVDHNHKTNAIRGLLCRPCNTKLGWVEYVGVNIIKTYLANPPYKKFLVKADLESYYGLEGTDV